MGQDLTRVRSSDLDGSCVPPPTDLSNESTRAGTKVKKVQNSLWTVEMLPKAKT